MMGAFNDRLREIYRHLLCPHCQNPVFVGEQPAVMRGTILAHKACREESRRADEYQREHPGASYGEALAAVQKDLRSRRDDE